MTAATAHTAIPADRPAETTTRERAIVFTAPMVRAILNGPKTQTRRLAHLNAAGRVSLGGRNWHPRDPEAGLSSPLGQPGDRLWVRETFGLVDPATCDDSVTFRTVDRGNAGVAHVVYAATGDLTEWNIDDGDEYDARGRRRSRWRSPYDMHRWASRRTLEVLSNRVQRVQEISEADAIAEGVGPSPSVPSCGCNREDCQVCAHLAAMAHRIAYSELWDSIYAKPRPVRRFGEIVSYVAYPWSKHHPVNWMATYRDLALTVHPNPYVHAVEFRRLTP